MPDRSPSAAAPDGLKHDWLIFHNFTVMADEKRRVLQPPSLLLQTSLFVPTLTRMNAWSGLSSLSPN